MIMDISKYKPTPKILDKLEGYRKKGSKVNVKAITNPDKLFTYYYAGKLMNWKDLLNDIWDKVSYEDRNVLKEIDTAVSADSTLEDSRSADEVALQNISKVVAAYLKEKNLSYTLTSRRPYYNELEMDRRNGRCWTLAYTLTVEGTLKIDFANHTNEGGGTYGYSIGGYGWNVLSKKELENRIIRKIEESDLGISHTDFHEEFEEYENLWEDWSTRYTKGKYEASINNDRYEDPSFEDEFLPMDFVISKEGKSIETVRGLGRVRKRIDELIAQDVKNYKKSLANKYVINFDYNGSLSNDVTAEALADVYIKYEVMDDALSTYCSFDITDVKLFDSYEQAKDFLESLNEKFYNLTGSSIWAAEIDAADDFITPALELDNRYFSFLTK
jgi:hypothetical protein